MADKIEEYLASINDEQTVEDSRVLTKMMQRMTGREPKLWNVGTLGFDTYHYKYDSGREGDGHVLGFYPRKGKTTIYLMDGTARYSELPILEQILQTSYENIKSQDGHINEILWKK
jgi:hypothetical protein